MLQEVILNKISNTAQKMETSMNMVIAQNKEIEQILKHSEKKLPTVQQLEKWQKLIWDCISVTQEQWKNLSILM